MRLVESDQPPLRIALACCLQRNLYSGWMMRIIVNHHNIVEHTPITVQRPLMADLKTPPSACEIFQRLDDRVGIDTQHMSSGKGCQRILYAVRSRQLQANNTLLREWPIPTPLHPKTCLAQQFDIISTISINLIR